MGQNILATLQKGADTINQVSRQVKQAEDVVSQISKDGENISQLISNTPKQMRTDEVPSLVAASNVERIPIVSKIVNDDIPDSEKSKDVVSDILTSVDKVDVFVKANKIVLSITDNLGMLYYLERMLKSFVQSSSLLLTMRTD